jgi:hypothetical protein
MRTRDKIALVALAILIFVVTGGISCNYFSTGVIDLILVAILGVLVFVAVGVVGCSYGATRMAKRDNS